MSQVKVVHINIRIDPALLFSIRYYWPNNRVINRIYQDSVRNLSTDQHAAVEKRGRQMAATIKRYEKHLEEPADCFQQIENTDLHVRYNRQGFIESCSHRPVDQLRYLLDSVNCAGNFLKRSEN